MAVDIRDRSRCYFVQIFGDAAEELGGGFVVGDIAADPESVPSRLEIRTFDRTNRRVDSRRVRAGGLYEIAGRGRSTG